MSLIGKRAQTVLNTPPAPVPNPEYAEMADAGKVRLDSIVTRVERTVAASQELFASKAANELRRW